MSHTEPTTSMADEFPKQQARCRELLTLYREIGPGGAFAAMMIEDMLRRADAAAMSGDVIAMIQVYAEMVESK